MPTFLLRPRTLLATCCAVFLLPYPARSAVWTSNGPTGGVVESVAVDPTASSTVYAGTSGGGIFKSLDGGATWSASSIGIPTMSGLIITGIAVDPLTPSKVYASVNSGPGGGTLRSMNGGASWTFTNVGSATAIAVDPATPSTIYTSGAPSILKSIDSGVTWNPVDTSNTFSIAIDPNAPGTVYAGQLGSLRKTTNGGATWTSVGGGFTGGDAIHAIAVNPAASNILYAGTFSNGVYRSIDFGANWTKLGPTVGTEDLSVRSLVIDPANTNIVYAGGIASAGIGGVGVFKTTNGGTNWTGTPLAASARALGLVSATTLVAGTQDLGVYRTTNGGTSWSEANTGVVNTSVYSMGVDPSNPGTVWAGTGRNGVARTANGGNSWVGTTFFDNVAVASVTVDPSAPGTVYAGDSGSFGVHKTIDSGAVWTPLGGTNAPINAYALILDPSNPSIVYAGVALGGFIVSPNGGATWNPPMNTGLFPVIISMVMDAAAPGTFYAGTDPLMGPFTGVFKTTNGGGQWNAINTGLPAVTGIGVVGLAIDVASPTTLYAAIEANGIFKTTNGGTSWGAANSGLTSLNVSAVAIDPVLPNTIYASTRDQGVFTSTDGGGLWTATNVGLYNLDIRSLAVEDGRVYAGSSGNGTFVMPTGSSTTTTSTTSPTTTSTSLPPALLGKQLLIKDPKPGPITPMPEKRKVVVQAKETAADETLDPATLVANGATITISAAGGTPSSQTFSMPPPWIAVGTTGAKYADKAGVNGPVKSAVVKRSQSGVFELKVLVLGKLGPGPQPHVVLVPPNPGTSGKAVFQITGGATYCMGFGGAAGGVITNKGAQQFKVSKTTVEVCP